MDLEDSMDAMLRQCSVVWLMISRDEHGYLPQYDVTELGAMINLEPGVIVRLMRMLTSTGIIVITGEDTYAHTPKSKA
ncbi:uncharacterized protein L3040_001937 [Drepanopeziza brunnea f. sp. 'multigermtubi']|uniref:uncharacterized protein n=1 Tax=Drepanopeziza brunnea f. sp. 'multigermtubi' TaxID=698441 RepID=UPI0023990F52|nr:hypothetical protein L3040_001937 [Drepanopeziza brunnea f. sp. 'multigermtubi']